MIQVDEETNVITIVRGDSGYVTVPLVEVTEDEHGQKVETPYDMKSGETLRFAAAKKWGATEDECFIIREINAPDMKLYFHPEDTKSQKFGTYKYDLEFTNEEGYIDTILRSEFIISEEVF